MKEKTLLFFILILILGFSCSKECPNQNNYDLGASNLVGSWSVESITTFYSADTIITYGSYIYSILFNVNGTGKIYWPEHEKWYDIEWIYTTVPHKAMIVYKDNLVLNSKKYDVLLNSSNAHRWERVGLQNFEGEYTVKTLYFTKE